MKLVAYFLMFLFTVFNYSYSADLENLAICGIKVEYMKLGKKQETFELSVEVDQTNLSLPECGILETVAFSDHVQSSWTIVDTSSGKVSLSIRRPMKYIEHIEMSFGFEQSPNKLNLLEADKYYRIKLDKLFE